MKEEKFYPIALLEKRMLAKDVAELRFAKPADFLFTAGQFVQFKIPTLNAAFALRSYSISSTRGKPYLEFCVKILPGGKASQYFKNLEVGATAQISQARGSFFVDEKAGEADKVFIATGTGLAPVIAMVENELARVREAVTAGQGGAGAEIYSPKITLIFGVRSEADLFWIERLNNFSVQQNFELMITLSRPSEGWAGFKGRVTNQLQIIDDSAHYYLCGSLEMVKDVRSALTAGNVPSKQIHFEVF